MKRVLVIGTGGTIASTMGTEGLSPELSSSQLLEFVPAAAEICRAECRQLFNLDSTDIGPRHWVEIASAIQCEYDAYDGFVICHGTDTMAYTAAALSYLIQGSGKPIVLTGAQKPINYDSTDSRVNLRDALLCASCDSLHGVMIVFNGKVIQGTRACKTRSKSYEAFSSINYPCLAVVQDGKLLQYIENGYLPTPVFYNKLDEKVALLKLIPGMGPEAAEYMLSLNSALILESFGVGGIPAYGGRDFTAVLDSAIARGKTVVLTTQVQNEGSDVGIYSVGRRLRSGGHILEAFDMTTESITAKLMWILAVTRDEAEIRRMFYTPVANDILNYDFR